MTDNLHLIHMLFSREVVLRGMLRGLGCVDFVIKTTEKCIVNDG